MRSSRFYQFVVFGFALWLCSVPLRAQDEIETPVYLTMRLFEVRVPKNQGALSNQVFRMRTAAQTDDEKWVSNLRKSYPEAVGVALLRAQEFRLFRRPKPGVITLGDIKTSHIEAQVLVAQGLRDDDTVNTTALTEINLYSGSRTTHPIPMALSSNGFEIAPSMTYFYTAEGMRLRPDLYKAHVREQSYSPSFDAYDHYLVLALSSENEKPAIATLDYAKSAELQTKASKRPEPQWPEEIKKQSLFGRVQVRAEVSADGKVTAAQIWQSTMPEGNEAARTAALQWEFPASEMAGIKAPVSALLTFTIAPPKASESKPEGKKPEPNAPTPTPSAETKTAAQTKPAATAPTARSRRSSSAATRTSASPGRRRTCSTARGSSPSTRRSTRTRTRS